VLNILNVPRFIFRLVSREKVANTAAGLVRIALRAAQRRLAPSCRPPAALGPADRDVLNSRRAVNLQLAGDLDVAGQLDQTRAAASGRAPAETTVPDWAARLVCGKCGSPQGLSGERDPLAATGTPQGQLSTLCGRSALAAGAGLHGPNSVIAGCQPMGPRVDFCCHNTRQCAFFSAVRVGYPHA
jgi:hypothetical protein